MEWPTSLLGVLCVMLGVVLTLGLPVQRRPLAHRAWDFVTLATFILGLWWINYWDTLSNFGVGLIAGVVALLIRDLRLWLARFRGQAYRRSHRYYWYGRARDWYGQRRRRRY